MNEEEKKREKKSCPLFPTPQQLLVKTLTFFFAIVDLLRPIGLLDNRPWLKKKGKKIDRQSNI